MSGSCDTEAGPQEATVPGNCIVLKLQEPLPVGHIVMYQYPEGRTVVFRIPLCNWIIKIPGVKELITGTVTNYVLPSSCHQKTLELNAPTIFLDPDSGWYCFLHIFTQQQHSQPDSSVSWLVKLPVSNQQPAVSPTSSAQIPEYQYKSKGCFVFFVFLWLRETNICCCGMTTRFHLRAHISEQIRFPSDPLLFLTVLWVLIPFFPPGSERTLV